MLDCLLGLRDLAAVPGGTWRLCLRCWSLLALLSISQPGACAGGAARRGTATLCLLPSPSVLVLVRISSELELLWG